MHLENQIVAKGSMEGVLNLLCQCLLQLSVDGVLVSSFSL